MDICPGLYHVGIVDRILPPDMAHRCKAHVHDGTSIHAVISIKSITHYDARNTFQVLNSTHVRCTCNHLTNFAVLVSSDEVSSENEQVLSIITYVHSFSFSAIIPFILSVNKCESESESR